MKFKLFGQSGLRVSELCLGTMTFGDEWGWGASGDESRKVFEAFAEEGGNFLDTANKYTDGTSEKLVGDFVGGERDKWVIATKYTANTREGDPNAGGNSRKSLVQSVEASLKRLNTDYIDVLWLHAWDGLTPVEEVMRSLDDLVRSGKVLYLGVSDTPSWIVSQANTLAQLRGLTQWIGLQVEYSLIERTPERDLLPMARAFGMTITPWSPLASGILTGKYNKQSANGEAKRLDKNELHSLSERNLSIAQATVDLAQEIGRSPSQVALAWLRAQGADVIPIIGSRKESQLRDNMKCLDLKLESEQLARLSDASKVELGFPHEFLAREELMDWFIHGGTKQRLDV